MGVPGGKSAARAVGLTIVFILFLALAFTFLYPLFFMLANSLKSSADYMANVFSLPAPDRWKLDNYSIIVSQFNILLYFRNSAIVTVVTVALLLALSTFAGYALAKLRFRGSRPIFLALFATTFIPAQVTLIPLYVMFARLGLVNNLAAVIATYLAAFLPAAILLLASNFRAIPDSMIESARIDGAGYFSTVWSIVVPMGKPALGICIIFNVISAWNDLFTPLILLPKQEMKTVIVALAGLMSRFSSRPTLQLTGLIMASLPVLLVYLAFQKYIVKGLTMGSFR